MQAKNTMKFLALSLYKSLHECLDNKYLQDYIKFFVHPNMDALTVNWDARVLHLDAITLNKDAAKYIMDAATLVKDALALNINAHTSCLDASA